MHNVFDCREHGLDHTSTSYEPLPELIVSCHRAMCRMSL